MMADLNIPSLIFLRKLC